MTTDTAPPSTPASAPPRPRSGWGGVVLTVFVLAMDAVAVGAVTFWLVLSHWLSGIDGEPTAPEPRSPSMDWSLLIAYSVLATLLALTGYALARRGRTVASALQFLAALALCGAAGCSAAYGYG